MAIARASHNLLLVNMVRDLLMQVDRVLSLVTHFEPFQQRSMPQHEAVIDAIGGRDAEAARDAMQRWFKTAFVA